jgi:chromosome segregation ATPase
MANHNSKNMFSKACVASHAAVLSHVYTKQAELKRMTVEVEMQQAEISSKEADIQNADQTIIELRRELKSLDIENRESELRLQSLNANLQSAKSVFNKREEEFEKWEQNQLQVLASIQEQEEGIVEMLEKEEVNLNRVIAAFLNAPCMKKYKILSEITSKEDAETELRALQICDFDDEQNKQLRTVLLEYFRLSV